MKIRPADILIALAALASVPAVGAAQAEPEGALFLLLPVGAQGVSLGRAMTWVEGPEGAFWNPAGLAGVERSQVVVFRGDHFAGRATAASALWRQGGVGTLGFSYFLLDAGEIARRDEFGNPIGTTTIRDHLGVLTGAARLYEGLSAGASFKIIRFQYSCRGFCSDEGSTATTYAVDLGLQAEPSEGLRFGAMLAHLGPRLQVVNAEQADPLPSRVRAAVAYDVLAALLHPDDVKGWLALEVEDHVRDLGATSVYLGTEVVAGGVDALSLRAGYVWSENDPEDGGRVGLGLRYERFDLSIAKSLATTVTGETEPVHVTFSIGF